MIKAMEDQRLGRVIRALRRRLGWRQSDLAAKARCSQSVVSRAERGHLTASLPMVRRLLAALDATLVLDVRWRAGALDRLLDAVHAAIVGLLAERLRTLGWLVAIEVTYSEWGERGSYDLLAFHPPSGTLLVIEVKSDLPSVEGTLRKLDEKVRLATKVALERFGWRATSVGRLLVMPDDRTLRRRVAAQARTIDTVLPQRNVAVRRWLAEPAATPVFGGLLFVTHSHAGTAVRVRGGRSRIDPARSVTGSRDVAG
jgi:transcriptional regulator with XRE-family HTH domain